MIALYLNSIRIATKSAWRNFRKNLLYGSLNILGLATAYASLILVAAFIYQETSYEQFHEKADRIYRATHHIQGANDFDLHFARVPVDFINELPEAMPEIERLIRLQNQEQKYITIGEQRFKAENAYSTDPEIFEVFNLPLLNGNPTTALRQPNSVVISAGTAQKYFASTDVLGREIEVTGALSSEPQIFRVSGVMKDLPVNTHLPVKMLFSFASETERRGWAYVYTLLKPGVKISTIETKIPDFIDQRVASDDPPGFIFEFQALKSIHLHSHLAREIQPNGQIIYLYVFFWVGIFVWLIALVNFTNLSTALTLARSKEIGVRKVLGAGTKSLAVFSLTESITYSCCSLVIGGLLALASFPAFQNLTGIHLLLPWSWLISGMIGIALVSGLLAGILPAALMASVQILNSLKAGNNWSMRQRGNRITAKQVMITLQFTATVILVGSALVARQQFAFIQEKNLGLHQKQILGIPEVPDPVKPQYQIFKNRIKEIPGIQSVAACMQMPSSAIRDMGPVRYLGQSEEEEPVMMDMQIVDPEFVQLMDLQLLAGTAFDPEETLAPVPAFSEDYTLTQYLRETPRQYLINETAMRSLGWEDPSQAIGQQINWAIGPFELSFGAVRGVIQDFHQESLKNKIDPVVMTVEPLWLSNFLIQVETKNINGTLASIEDRWNELFPYPFEYHFLDDLFQQLYQQDQAQLRLLSILSIMAILISFLGVISMIAYALESRSKELAIRRVIGANLRQLTQLMGKEYFWVLGVAGIIGIPISYHFTSLWLQNFAYRIDIPVFVYFLAFVFLLVLLLLTIYWQTFRATLSNPIDALREE